MSKIDYSKTVIYKLSCNDESVPYVYYGSTIDTTKMKYQHKRQLVNGVENELYSTIRGNGGIEKWKFEILEHYTGCRSKHDATARCNSWKMGKIQNLPPKNAGDPPKTAGDPPKNAGDPPKNAGETLWSFLHDNAYVNSEKNPKNEDYGADSNEIICRYCEQTFTRKDSLSRHLKKRCQNYKMHQLENENMTLKNQLEEAKKNKTESNNNANAMTNSNNTTNNNTSNSHNNIQNNTNNTTNNINIMSFGKEDFSSIFGSKASRLKALKQKHSALLYRIEQGRCNKDHPELRNVVIKNLRSNVAHVYRNNIDPDNFIVMSIADVLDLILASDYTEIETDFEEIGHELDDNTRKCTGEFIRQMNENPDKVKEQKQSIKRMIYNLNRDVKTRDIDKS